MGVPVEKTSTRLQHETVLLIMKSVRTKTKPKTKPKTKTKPKPKPKMKQRPTRVWPPQPPARIGSVSVARKRTARNHPMVMSRALT